VLRKLEDSKRGESTVVPVTADCQLRLVPGKGWLNKKATAVATIYQQQDELPVSR